MKLLYTLLKVPIDKVSCIYCDSFGFNESHDELLKLNYVGTNRPMFK